MPPWRNALAGLCLALLAACATTPAPLPKGVSFELTGRFAVRSAQEAASGRLFWQHGPGFDDLMISTPLGQGVAEITRRAERYTLTTADSRRVIASDPEALTEQTLGWRLPLAGLPDWVRGQAYPGAESEVRYGANARPQLIRQLGWSIEFLAYDDQAGLPSRLRLTRDGLDIRLTIDSWATAPQ